VRIAVVADTSALVSAHGSELFSIVRIRVCVYVCVYVCVSVCVRVCAATACLYLCTN